LNLSRLAFVGAAAAALTAPLAAGAQTPGRPLRMIFFPGGDMLPATIAAQKGFFARENIAAVMTPTPGSVYQFQHLSAGDFDVAMTALDNAIAYDEGQVRRRCRTRPTSRGSMAAAACSCGFTRVPKSPRSPTSRARRWRWMP